MKTENKVQLLEQSYHNYKLITEKKMPYKFASLENWLLVKSNCLLFEVEEYEKSKELKRLHSVYERRTIVKADFGVNLGSEMSQMHLAIVISKGDNPKNDVVTVVPLASKENRFNLPLGKIIGSFIKRTEEELTKESVNFERGLTENNDKIEKLKAILSEYRNYDQVSYACTSLITTISKSRIFDPINEYDSIGVMKCPKELMSNIDSQILKWDTDIHLTKS